MELHGDMTLNRTMWPQYLYVYDDLLIAKKRRFFVVKEVTISYNHIAQVILNKGLLFATVKIETTGEDDILLKYVWAKNAVNDKKIIDQKIYHSHAKHSPTQEKDTNQINRYEKSLNRLKELVSRGQLSNKEFEKKKNELLKTLR